MLLKNTTSKIALTKLKKNVEIIEMKRMAYLELVKKVFIRNFEKYKCFFRILKIKNF